MSTIFGYEYVWYLERRNESLAKRRMRPVQCASKGHEYLTSAVVDHRKPGCIDAPFIPP